MTTLRTAAQQALEALELVTDLTNHDDEIYDAIDTLRAALVEDAMQKFTEVSQEIEAALAEPDWQDLYLKEKKRADMWREKYESVAGAEQRIHPLAEPVQEPQCNPHPKAPHGFMRNASHTEDRYVCECEGWEPYEAGYQAGMETALRAQS